MQSSIWHSWSVAPWHGCWRSLSVLQQLDSGAVQNHCSLKSSHWSRRMCCLHCCAYYPFTHYQEEGMGKFEKEGLLGQYSLYLGLLQCGYSSSKLFTPSFPGISMVWGHGLSLALLWYTSDCSLLCFSLDSGLPSNSTSVSSSRAQEKKLYSQENKAGGSLPFSDHVFLPSSEFLGAISSTDTILW